MRSLTCSTFDQTIKSLDMPNSKSISLCSTNNGFVELSDKKVSICLERDPRTQKSHGPNVYGASKGKIPEILMINKYYGLIPQKFAITCRSKTVLSSPTPASRRAPKSSSAKARAKSSSFHLAESKVGDARKGYRSENDSPEPIKMVVIARKESPSENERTNVDENSGDPLIGPVTKKMSVEKYKKWKHGGGGKGRNLNIRDYRNIAGKSLSLLDNRPPVDNAFPSHANRASTEHQTNRRVIKIDLNRVSREEGEENYQTTARSHEDMNRSTAHAVWTVTKPNGEPRAVIKGLPETASHDNGNSALDRRANIDNEMPSKSCVAVVSHDDEYDDDPRGFSRHVKDLLLKNLVSKSKCSCMTSSKGERSCEGCSNLSNFSGKQNEKPIDLSSTHLGTKGSSGESVPSCEKSQAAAGEQRGTLNKTISFDESIFDHDGTCGSRPDSLKKRPATASTPLRPLLLSNPFQTPNSFNPPSKVIPWTQQKTAAGKPLTLAERRAKFQRTTSVHSSSSMSLDVGEEEVSEVESLNNSTRLPVTSSVYKETRKPLYVIQPPEVPTMISQINPNADEDIQIEIEKVAIMLRKMQTLNNFSMSLDSGIEAEMVKASSDIGPLKSSSKMGIVMSSESDLCMEEICNTLNSSESDCSVTSIESNSSNEQSQLAGMPNSGQRIPIIKRGLGGEKVKSRDIKEQPTNRQCTAFGGTSSSGGTVISNSLNVTRKISSMTTTTSGSTPSTGRRPPLRKAVSISCEQELLKTGGVSRSNEVNSSANDNGRSPRPKTAAGSQSTQSCGTGTRSTHNYNQRGNVSSLTENHSTNGVAGNSGSQGLRNRKILIKKALMEINQSSVNLRKKWGTLGRPRTAPSSDTNCETVSPHLSSQLQQRRKPLKASPLAISGNARIVLASSGKSPATGGKSNADVPEGGTMEKTSSLGQSRASSEAREDCEKTNQDSGGNTKGKSVFRQCFSLDEGALLGFSIKSVGEGRIPIFEKWAEMEASESCSAAMLDDEISFLSSKKREQCLKVYEKMMKTGCTIKLDTVFRGMLTPSEYRAFMRAAERAALEAEEAERLRKRDGPGDTVIDNGDGKKKSDVNVGLSETLSFDNIDIKL